MNDQSIVRATPVARPSPWGICLYCGQPIYTSFLIMPAVNTRRGQPGYNVRVHVRCYDERQRQGR